MSVTCSKSYDEHTWTFTEHEITQVIVDPASVRLVSWRLDGAFDLRLGVPFEFTRVDGSSDTLDPERPTTLAPVLSFVGRSVGSVVVTRNGDLTLRFGDDSFVRVTSHAAFEAFEVSGEGMLADFNYLATPGGGSPWG